MIQNPRITDWTSAPLQNRVRVRLDAPVATVWRLVGDLARLLGIVDLNVMVWYEPGCGYASRGEKGDAFGLRDDINLVTVDACPGGTLLTWDEYFDAEDVEAMRASFDAALSGTAERLIARFGGELVERFVARAEEPSGAEATVADLAKAVNTNDLERAMALYEEQAVMVVLGGGEVRGRDQVREAMAQLIALRPTLVTEASRVVSSGDIASYVGRWRLDGVAPDGEPVRLSGESADVLRRQSDGRWLIALDNPWGPGVLPGAPESAAVGALAVGAPA